MHLLILSILKYLTKNGFKENYEYVQKWIELLKCLYGFVFIVFSKNNTCCNSYVILYTYS